MKHLSKEEILEEIKLIEQAKKQPKLFGVLYKRYYAEIANYVLSKVRDNSISHDITQQIFIKAMDNLPKYQFKGVPYIAFLYRIASNECNSYFRVQKKQRGISLDSEACKTIAYEVDEVNTDFTPLLISVLEKLSEDEVEFIELKYFESCSVKEMSYILKISESNVKVKGHRLLKTIKQLIN